MPDKLVHLGHSPDPDDAFMWYPLADFTGPDGTWYTPRIDTRGFRFVHVLKDIETLNEMSQRGELEITALSLHQYPFVADRYILTSCGCSMGDGYGPMLVARPQVALDRLKEGGGFRVAIPGRRTTAWLALQLYLREPGLGLGAESGITAEVVAFDEILAAVAVGRYDAGLIIHEGQLTYARHGLRCLVDLGQWWQESRGLPLPLGGNAIRRDLGDAAIGEICSVLMESIRYALGHREEAVRFALQWARGMDAGLADRFVGMYVNQWTLDYGPTGRAAVERLLGEAAAAGLVPEAGEIALATPQ